MHGTGTRLSLQGPFESWLGASPLPPPPQGLPSEKPRPRPSFGGERNRIHSGIWQQAEKSQSLQLQGWWRLERGHPWREWRGPRPTTCGEAQGRLQGDAHENGFPPWWSRKHAGVLAQTRERFGSKAPKQKKKKKALPAGLVLTNRDLESGGSGRTQPRSLHPVSKPGARYTRARRKGRRSGSAEGAPGRQGKYRTPPPPPSLRGFLTGFNWILPGAGHSPFLLP